MNNIIKKVLKPIIWLRHKRDDYLKGHNPAKLFSMRYSRMFGRPLNYKNPISLYDKIGYMAFYTDTSLWTRLADKLLVREYVKERGLSHLLTRLYGSYNNSLEIDFESLPDSFVLKTNHGSATNILVRDKTNFDYLSACHLLDKWLAHDYGYDTCQPHYSRIQPKIIAEEFLTDKVGGGKFLIDYKLYCINGNPEFMQVMTERVANTHQMKLMVFDMNWKAHPEYCSNIHQLADPDFPKPASFEEMKEAAKVLSKDIPFVRVDYYEIDGKPVFGEMTFTPGFDTMTLSFLDLLGKKLDLPHNRPKNDEPITKDIVETDSIHQKKTWRYFKKKRP